MQIVDTARFEAFVQMLAQPDPSDLPKRGHTYRYEGEANRRATRLPGILMGWLQRRHLTVDVEDAVSRAAKGARRYVRPANPGLRVLRPTGSD